MTSAELDRIFQRAAKRIVSAKIFGGHALATFDDGSQLEFALSEQRRPFTPKDFVGLTADEARALKSAPTA